MSEAAFGYVRVSGSSQVDKDGPKRQRDSISKFIDTHKFGFGGWFEDLAVSGTIDGLDRPQFAEMLGYCEERRVNIVVVEKLDRFARDLIVSEMLFRELRKRNIKLFACDQGAIDLATCDTDPSRTLIRQMFGALAEYEKSSLVIKLRLARQRVKRDTGRCEGVIPYGVGTTQRARVERTIIELIKQIRYTGANWDSVATMLTQGGMPKRNGSVTWRRSDAYKIYNRYLERGVLNAERNKQPEVT